MSLLHGHLKAQAPRRLQDQPSAAAGASGAGGLCINRHYFTQSACQALSSLDVLSHSAAVRMLRCMGCRRATAVHGVCIPAS